MSISRRKLIIGAGGTVLVAAGAGILTPMLRREGSLVPGRPRYGFVEGSNDELPKQADVVIIGAGINGIMTAIRLVERGMSVAVVEKGNIAGEQSSRAWKIAAFEEDSGPLGSGPGLAIRAQPGHGRAA